ncbi:MAG: PEGA domain-containing protein [Planctomycetota bacterium]|jgi:tetratricopeptide (TPR) repeat protein
MSHSNTKTGARRIAPAVACLTAAAAATGLGVLALGRGDRARIISTPPGASVFVDGEYGGVTPVEIRGLSPGTHALRVQKTGFAPFFGSVDSRGRGALVRVQLEPVATGAIDVSTTPTGAEVYLDGELRGRSPLCLERVRTGAHVLRLRKEHHGAVTLTMRVAAGERTIAEADLEDLTLAYLEHAVAAKPDEPFRYMELGHYLRIIGSLEAAAEVYREGLMVSCRNLLLSRRLDAKGRERAYRRYTLFARQLYYDRAPSKSGPLAAEFAKLMAPACAEVYRVYPPEVMRSVRLAWGYEDTGQIEQATKKVEGLVEIARACVEIREYLAELRLASGDAEGAIAAFREALKLAEDDAGGPQTGADATHGASAARPRPDGRAPVRARIRRVPTLATVVVRLAEVCLGKHDKLSIEARSKLLAFSAEQLARAAESATGAEAARIAELEASVRRELHSLKSE